MAAPEKSSQLNGQAFLEELRELLSDDNKPIPSKAVNRLMLTGMLELHEKINILNGNVTKEISELRDKSTDKWLSRNWKTLLFVATAFFLILHSIIPADVSLWSFFAKILGGG